jgi:hypothetical protein
LFDAAGFTVLATGYTIAALNQQGKRMFLAIMEELKPFS